MRCEDEKMFYRPPLLEEPCAQTLSGIKNWRMGMGRRSCSHFMGLSNMIGHEKWGITVEASRSENHPWPKGFG